MTTLFTSVFSISGPSASFSEQLKQCFSARAQHIQRAIKNWLVKKLSYQTSRESQIIFFNLIKPTYQNQTTLDEEILGGVLECTIIGLQI